MAINLTLDIVNEKGLHARASAKFVELVEAHDARVEVSRNGVVVPGDSIMGLLTLGASQGTQIELTIDGAEAEILSAKLIELVAEKFGEGQ
ncbi:MAG: HPr family phosphocarrier protein [Paracoccaceae bacterium]